MKRLIKRCLPMLLLCLTCCGAHLAATAADPLPAEAVDGEIAVKGQIVDQKDYRTLWAAQLAFEQHKSLAPEASLRFRLIPLRPQASLEQASLHLVGETASVDVPIAADGTFSLPYVQAMYDEHAAMLLNRKADQFGWAPEVRSPGLPDNARRLGDLRLQCEAGDAANLKPIGVAILLAQRAALVMNGGYCHGWSSDVLFPAPAGATRVTLVDGTRRLELPDRASGASFAIKHNGSIMHGPGWYTSTMILLPPLIRQDHLVNGGYVVPLNDTSWPDDTLVVFDDTKSATTEAEGVVTK